MNILALILGAIIGSFLFFIKRQIDEWPYV